MKKTLSLLLVLAMLLSVLTGITLASAEEAPALTVYTQTGDAGEKTEAGSYTADKLTALLEKGSNGYIYYKGGAWNAVVATEYVGLDALLADAGVTFGPGDYLVFTCTDGEYTKFYPTYESLQTGKYYIDANGSTEVPAAFAITWQQGSLADGTVAEIAAKAENTGNIRFVCGVTEAEYANTSAAGKRMPSGIVSVTVVHPVSFADVATADWFNESVLWCANKGLFKGTGNGAFAPNRDMNASELLTVLYRVAGNVSDGSGAVWYEKELAWANSQNLMKAEGFKDAPITRQDFITMFYKTAAIAGLDTAVTDEMRESLKAATDYAAIDAANIDAMAWAVASGLIKGVSGDTLTIDAGAAVTRATVCTMLQRYYSAK